MPIEQNMEINQKTIMRTRTIIFSFAKVFLIVNFCIIAYSLLAHNTIWLLNTQVAFIGSLFVTLASFLSYRRNIKNRLSSYEKHINNLDIEDRDKIDEIDDPFDLYSEYKEIPKEELSTEKIKQIIKEEKSKIKKNSFKNTIFSAGGFVSIYRIAGYIFLLFGFFALNNNKLFMAIPFLIGLGIVPLSVLISKFILKLEVNE